MSRKYTRRKVWPTPAIPISFSLHNAGLRKSNLIARAALDAIISGVGGYDEAATLASAAAYGDLMCGRLEADGSIEPDQIAAARAICRSGSEAIADVQSRLPLNAGTACSPSSANALDALLSIGEQLDAVSTRRQARDVALALLKSFLSTIDQPRDPHALPNPQ